MEKKLQFHLTQICIIFEENFHWVPIFCYIKILVRDVLCQQLRRRLGLVIIGCRIFQRSTTGRKQIANNRIDGCTRMNGLTQPLVIKLERFGTHPIVRSNLKQFGPFHDPDITKLWSLQKAVNTSLTFVHGRISHEIVKLFFGRQLSNQIDGDSAKELFVAC